MIPRNVFRYRVFVLCLALIAFGYNIVPAQNPWKLYCASTLDQPTVYFSNIFGANTKARTQISTLPLGFAFKNFLVEEYDFKSSSNYPAGCGFFQTLSQAEANKRQLVAQAQKAKKQVVEVNWNPGLLAEVPQGDGASIGPAGPTHTHTICALGHGNIMYFSAVFETAGWQPAPALNNAFNNFLRKNYGAEGEANCTSMNTLREATRLLRDRVGGVRANNRKAVETGWKFDPTDIAGNKPRPKPAPTPDDDPEPVAQQRPTPAKPSQSIKDFAAKEGPQVLDYCRKDPMLRKIFDCYRVQRSVYNYRMAHGSGESLVSLFTQEKVNLAEAIGTGLGLWVRERATAQGLDNRVTNCIEQKFNVSFYGKPYISKMQEIYNTSAAACKPPPE